MINFRNGYTLIGINKRIMCTRGVSGLMLEVHYTYHLKHFPKLIDEGFKLDVST